MPNLRCERFGPFDLEELGEIVAELRNYSRKTHHEKIIRGISLYLVLDIWNTDR